MCCLFGALLGRRPDYWPKHVGEHIMNKKFIVKLKCISWMCIRFTYLLKYYMFNRNCSLQEISGRIFEFDIEISRWKAASSKSASGWYISQKDLSLLMICVYTFIKSNAQRGVEVRLHSSLTFALVSGEQIRIICKRT